MFRFRRRRSVDDFSHEIESHIALEVQRLVDEGMSPEAARDQARRRFGNVTTSRERFYEANSGEQLAQLWREHVRAARRLRAHAAFTLVVALTLALAIGGTTAIYSVVSAVLLEPLPYPHPEELVRVYGQNQRAGDLPLSPADFSEFRDGSTVFASIAAFSREGHEFRGSVGPENLEGLFVSAGYVELLGARVQLGRTFSRDDERPGNADRVIVSDRIWRTRLNADPAIVGQTVNLSRRPFEVVGVMAPGIQHVGGKQRSLPHGETADFWIPLTFNPANLPRGARWLNSVGRLAAGVTPAQANAELERLSALQAQRFPDTHTGWRTTVIPLAAEIVGPARPVLMAILGAVLCVLLVACGNVACLSLGRSIARTREHAVRAALGASRWRVAREILVESWLLALVGAALGIPLAIAGVRGLVQLAPPHLPRLHAIGVDAGMVAIGLGVTLITSMLCGLLPAWYGARTNLDEALRESGRSGGPGARSLGWHRVLVVAQLALCFALVVSAGLLGRTFLLLQQQSFGFKPEGVLTMTFDLPGAVTRYGRDVKERAMFHERLLTSLRAQPGVVSAGSAARLPFATQLDATDTPALRAFSIVNRPVSPDQRPFARVELVSDGYLETIGVPFAEGRGFDARDTLTSAPVALVSRELVRRYLSGELVIGQGINGMSRVPLTIVGVVEDVKATPTSLAAEPTIYVPMSQMPIFRTRLAVRTAGDPTALLPIVTRAVTSIDPELPVFDVKPLTQITSDAVATQRFALLLFGLFAALTLVLSIVGIYGVLAYSVQHRVPEFGVRLALGARPTQLISMVMTQGAWMVAVGLVLGAGASVLATRGIRGLLFGVRPFDPLTLSAVALVFCAVAAVACLGPALRAGRVDPLTALRGD
jgi:putative ABC transport system permease protein